MKTVILARHAQSSHGARGVMNGDPDIANPLTECGEAQARRLGELVAADPIDLAVVTSFERTHRTAAIALEGRDVPFAVVPELDEIAYGRWEGRPFAEYAEWAWSAAAAAACPGGGESRTGAIERLLRGWHLLLAREEDMALVVCHGLAIRYLLNALHGSSPAPRLDQVPLAQPFRLTAPHLRHAVATIERWLAAPTW